MGDPRDGTSPADDWADGGERPPLASFAELRELLAGRDEWDVLVALFEGDPLRMSERAEGWLTEHAYVIDRRQLALKALSRIPDRVRGEAGSPDLGGWLAELLADVAREVLLEDGERAAAAEAPEEPIEPRFLFLQQALGTSPVGARRASVALNGLPENERRAAYAVLVEKQGFTAYARRNGLTAREARDLLVRVLGKIKKAAEGDPEHE